MTGAPHNGPSSFWTELEQYLRNFYKSLSSTGSPSTLSGGSIWARPAHGTLHLSAEAAREYRRILDTACKRLAPDGDLSEAVIDSVLKDAVFMVANPAETEACDVEHRIRAGIEAAKAAVGAAPHGYQCWVEVTGLNEDSLPARFGTTEFKVLSRTDSAHLANTIHTKHTAGQAQKIECLAEIAGDIEGRAVAVQRVRARDPQAAIAIAVDRVSVALECLNCFAEVIPYNNARLRVARGPAGAGTSVRLALADEGSIRIDPAVRIPWTYSFGELWQLTGLAGEAMHRVDSLLTKADRTAVDDLLMRAVRWMGRAAAAHRAEDRFLFSVIAIDCVVRPVGGLNVKQNLIRRTAMVLRDFVAPQEIERLYNLRNKLVHDGRLEEVSEEDEASIQTMALNLVLRVLTINEVASAIDLQELEDYFQGLVSADCASPGTH